MMSINIIFGILLALIVLFVIISFFLDMANNFEMGQRFAVTAGFLFLMLILSVYVHIETNKQTYKQAIKDMHNCELKYEMYVLPNNDTVFYKKKKK